MTSKPVPLPLNFAKQLAVKNLDFMINSAVNLNVSYPALGFETVTEKLSQIRADLQNQDKIKDTIEIQKFMETFTTAEFNELHFFNRDFSNKLSQFLAILNMLFRDNPDEIVSIVISVGEKNTPKGVDKNQFLVEKASKFIATTNQVKITTETILDAINKRLEKERRIDVLSVAGMLLLMVGQRETFVYYVVENLKKAQSILNSTYDIEEICSIDSKVTQNTKYEVDMVAICNCISHFAYTIEDDHEVVVDFHGPLEGYDINRKYTAIQLVNFYKNYDRLIDIQALLIRSAFLQSLLLYFRK